MKRYFDEPSPVPDCGFGKEMFLESERYLKPTVDKQVITGNGVISGDSYHVHLEAVAGSWVVHLPDGTTEHEEQWIFHTGTGGSFNVRGSFLWGGGLQFDAGGTSALLKWVKNRWEFVMGTARVIA
jgi:hypothetical protein